MAYRVRGDVIDIFPAESDDEAIRIELFDDEVESIVISIPSRARCAINSRATIYPKPTMSRLGKTILDAIDSIKSNLKSALSISANTIYYRSVKRLSSAPITI